MDNWNRTLLDKNSSIISALKQLDEVSSQILLVVDRNNVLQGTVTDGDLRRGIINNYSLEDPVSKVMNQNFVYARSTDTDHQIYELTKKHKIRQIPILDSNSKVLDLKTLLELFKTKRKENWVFLMAGGLGSRLGEMTKKIPKPLLKVGKKPLIETIIENFIDKGFHKFYLSINYLAEKIIEALGDGSKWGVQIEYIIEKKRMGTAGSLGLIKNIPEKPMIVMNTDILTKVNFERVLNDFSNNGADALMCVREYQHQIPYGVVRTKENIIQSIEEKPSQSFLINAGIYILHPEVIQYIPKDTFFDIVELFTKLISLKKKPVIYPIEDYWLDIGKIKDFQQAQIDYEKFF